MEAEECLEQQARVLRRSVRNVAAAHMRCNLAKQGGLPVDRHELLASLGLSVVQWPVHKHTTKET